MLWLVMLTLELKQVADRITVLRLGQAVAVLNRQETTQQEVVHAITAGTVDSVPGMQPTEPEVAQ